MPRKPCFWTRKHELELVQFIRERDYIWKPVGNTNHQIQKKYKAYAEFASKLGWGFTARSVRDRWVNIRSTFNHNLRKVDKSRETAALPADVYVPCWPLWKPLQFLRSVGQNDDICEMYSGITCDSKNTINNVKEEMTSDIEDLNMTIRQRGQRTDRPRKRKIVKSKITKCRRVIDDLLTAMKPLTCTTFTKEENYWFFGKHITERLNNMRDIDADCAIREIMKILEEFLPSKALDTEQISSYNIT